MAKKTTLKQLNKEKEKAGKPAKKTPAKGKAAQELDPNPKRGERGDFLKTTITISAEMLGQLKMLGLTRKAAGERNTDVSSLVREAVALLLSQEGK